jgi:hypothetical protein
MEATFDAEFCAVTSRTGPATKKTTTNITNNQGGRCRESTSVTSTGPPNGPQSIATPPSKGLDEGRRNALHMSSAADTDREPWMIAAMKVS